MQWYTTLGRRAGVLAYLNLAMRGNLAAEQTSSLLFSRQGTLTPSFLFLNFFFFFCVVPGDDEATLPALSLAQLEQRGFLFRVQDSCTLPYAIICRANATNPNLNLPPDVFKPLGQTTTWQSFEQIAPYLVYVLLQGYYVRGKDHILVSDLWRGAYGASNLLNQELSVPETYSVYKETETWIRQQEPVVKQGHLYAKLVNSKQKNVLRDLGAYICGTNNFRIDARYSLHDASGRTVLILEQSKHSLSEVKVATETILTWYREAKEMMARSLPHMKHSPSRVIYIFFSNRHLSDPAELHAKLEEEHYRDLLVIVHSNISRHVSDVFSFLVEAP